MLGDNETRKVGDFVVITAKPVRGKEGNRVFIPDTVDPGTNIIGIPDWVKEFEVLNSKGEVIFRLPMGARIRPVI